MRRNPSQKDFGVIPGMVLLAVVIGVLGLIGLGVYTQRNDNSGSYKSNSKISWYFDDYTWKPSGTPPECPDPLLVTPVDITKVVSIMYPGQYRGGDYKAHGGFRFEDDANNSISVKVPLDAVVYKGSRYIEQGEVQYYFVMIAPCGIMYKFDHLLTLSPAFQEIANTLPEPKVNDSRTTNFNPAPSVRAGDLVATAIGFVNSGNAGLDFGLYDLRQKNSVSQSPVWRKEHSKDNEYSPYGLCWLDYLVESDRVTIKALSGSDWQAGKQSDYCE